MHRNTGDGNTRTEHDGAALENPPAAAIDWPAHTSGTGVQTLRRNADAGEQRLVVMNADGSSSVGGHVISSEVTVPGLPWIATGLVVGGFIVLAGGIVLIVRPGRRARRESGRNQAAST